MTNRSDPSDRPPPSPPARSGGRHRHAAEDGEPTATLSVKDLMARLAADAAPAELPPLPPLDPAPVRHEPASERLPEPVRAPAPDQLLLPPPRHLDVVELERPEQEEDEHTPADLPGVATPSRAGRNLPAAIGVGLSLGVVILASLLLYRPSFLAVLGIAVVLAVYELRTAIATVEARPPLVPLLVGALAMGAAGWVRGTSGLAIAALLTVAGLVIWRLADGVSGYLRDLSAAVLILLYVPLLAGFAVLLTHPHDGAARVITFIALVVCSDTGGYAAGVLFGRHPLAPTVSKGKTWEGVAGSVLFGGVAGSLILSLTFHEQWWKGLLFGLAMVLGATLGDLGESMIKRDLGLKDMGHLLPGHGGVMDRLDSLLPCAVIAYLLLSLFAPV